MIARFVSITVCQSLCEQPPLISDSSDQTIIASEATQVGMVIRFQFFVRNKSRDMRKPAFCTKTKVHNRTADQRLCLRYIDIV